MIVGGKDRWVCPSFPRVLALFALSGVLISMPLTLYGLIAKESRLGVPSSRILASSNFTSSPGAFIRQRYLDDCGPAAVANLYMVSGHIPNLERLEREIPRQTFGTDIADLSKALALDGHRNTYTHRRLLDISNRDVPALALVEGHFFVVLSRLKHDRLSIIDPVLGRGTLKLKADSGVVPMLVSIEAT